MARRTIDICEHIPVDPNLWTEDDWRDLRDGINAIRRKIAERHQARMPAFRCERCGATGHFVGKFTPPAFERQAADFKAKHRDCPLSIDGGGI